VVLNFTGNLHVVVFARLGEGNYDKERDEVRAMDGKPLVNGCAEDVAQKRSSIGRRGRGVVKVSRERGERPKYRAMGGRNIFRKKESISRLTGNDEGAKIEMQ